MSTIQACNNFSYGYGQNSKRPSSINSEKDEKDKNGAFKKLDKDEQKEVNELKKTDREVRAHEQAHLAAAGGLATSGANYEYKTGPDGKKYAVAGDVHIDVSEGKDPEQTIRKAEKIKRAALAPAKPSAQDRAVAAKVSAMEAKARMELAKKQYSNNSTNHQISEPRLKNYYA
jgi:hypothetical protein